MSIVSSHHQCQPSIIPERCVTEAISKVSCSRYCSGRLAFSHSLCLKATCGQTGRTRFSRICSVVDDGMNPDEEENESLDDQTKRVCEKRKPSWFLKFITSVDLLLLGLLGIGIHLIILFEHMFLFVSSKRMI